MRYDTILRLSESIVSRHVGGFTFFHGVSVDKNDSESDRFPLAYLVPIDGTDVLLGDEGGAAINYALTFFLVDVLATDRKDEEVSDTVAQYHTACSDIVGEFRRLGATESTFNGETLDFTITTEADYLPIIDDGSTNMTGCQVTFSITDNIARDHCNNPNFSSDLEVNELNQFIVDDRENKIAVEE